MDSRRSMAHRKPTYRWTLPLARAGAAVLAAIGIALVWPTAARPAQVQLRAECRCREPVVTLGHVAKVSAADPREADVLAAVELVPAPPPDTKRFLRAREIQDLLLLHGVNLLEHQISGASQVVVLGPMMESEPASDRLLSVSTAKQAERRIREAIVRYLEEHVPDAQSWSVNIKLDDTALNAHLRLAASRASEISARGGMAPWEGLQRFEITVRSSDGPVRFDVDAQVASPPSVVVAARSLPRGAVIGAADVQLQQAGTLDGRSEGFHSIDDVLGKHATRTIPAGKILDPNSVRQPLLVRRGEMITVYARSAGICVRSTARARDHGSLGDLIEVESLPGREAYFARVCGSQEVELYARATQADRSGGADFGRSTGDLGTRR